MDMSENDERRHRLHPDILKEYAGLLGDVSNLVDLITRGENAKDRTEDFDTFTVPLIDEDDAIIPDRIRQAMGRITHFTISPGIYRDTEPFLTHLAITLFAGPKAYHIHRYTGSESTEIDNDVISNTQNDTLERKEAMSDTELSQFLLSVMLSDRRSELAIDQHQKADFLSPASLKAMSAILAVKGIHSDSTLVYDFKTSDANVFFSQENGQPSYFALQYSTPDDRTGFVNYSIETELTISFETRETVELGPPFEGTTQQRNPFQPEPKDIAYIRNIILNEITHLEEETEKYTISGDELIFDPDQNDTKVQRFSPEATKIVLDRLDFDSPESSEMTDD
jgi:hypothetical protein